MASARTTRLTSRQQALLAGFTVTDNRAQFMGTKIDDWPTIKKVMLALGGEWKKGKTATTGGFVFSEDVDAAEIIRLARETGEILDPNTHDFYPTPDDLADRVVSLAQISPGMNVLEPSAGTGALALAVRRAQPKAHVVCVELLPKHQQALSVLGFTVAMADDFLREHPRAPGVYDRVVMNPPFSRRADIHHVEHAFAFLKPGGRLVAIMSAGVKYRADKLGGAFTALLFENQATIYDNPAGSFKAAGTMVNTVTVVLPKRA